MERDPNEVEDPDPKTGEENPPADPAEPAEGGPKPPETA